MSLGRTTILSISAALLSASLLLGCAGSRDAEPPLGRTFDTPAYVLDPSFPRPSWVTFDTVSWVDRDPESNLVYVLQRSAPPVSAWTADGELVSTWTTQVLGDPHSISFDTGPDGSTTVWITDMAPPLLVGQGYGHCLKSFTLSGEFLSTIGTCGENSQGTGLDPVQFDKVTDVAWDAAGNLLVSDGDLNGLNNRVLKLDSSGVVLASWSTPGDQPGSGPAQFDLPHMLIVDRCDRIWVADALNHRVQVIANDGTFLGVYAVAFGASLLFASGDDTLRRRQPDLWWGDGEDFPVCGADGLYATYHRKPGRFWDLRCSDTHLDIDDTPSLDDCRPGDLGRLLGGARRQAPPAKVGPSLARR